MGGHYGIEGAWEGSEGQKKLRAALDRIKPAAAETPKAATAETPKAPAEKILNLTQHSASQEQISAGVVDPPPAEKAKIAELLTFSAIPTKREISSRALDLALLAHKLEARKCMIGGAPYLMGPLESALRGARITPLYAFSQRVVVEKNGIKASTFRHDGFVEA